MRGRLDERKKHRSSTRRGLGSDPVRGSRTPLRPPRSVRARKATDARFCLVPGRQRSKPEAPSANSERPMITLRMNHDRHLAQQGDQEIRHTFSPREQRGPGSDDFGLLIAFDEIRLPPNEISAFLPLKGLEIITYLYNGTLTQETPAGSSEVVYAGEFQRMVIGIGIRHKETSTLQGDFTRLFRISLHPTEVGLDSAHEQKRFMVGERRNRFCEIASPDGRRRSLRILQDAVLYSSILDPGRHLAYELSLGRSAWLHVINGEATMGDMTLTEGDGVGITLEPILSLTATVSTELLLIDLGTGLPFGPGRKV